MGVMEKKPKLLWYKSLLWRSLIELAKRDSFNDDAVDLHNKWLSWAKVEDIAFALHDLKKANLISKNEIGMFKGTNNSMDISELSIDEYLEGHLVFSNQITNLLDKKYSGGTRLAVVNTSNELFQKWHQDVSEATQRLLDSSDKLANSDTGCYALSITGTDILRGVQ